MGHNVALTTPQFDAVQKFIEKDSVKLFATPDLGTRSHRLRVLRSFSEILHNTCFNSRLQIQARCESWLSIFQAIRPDVIVCEHAPSALLAARVYGTKLVAMGTGFTLPAEVAYMPDWRPELKTATAVLQDADRRILGLLNKWLRERSVAELSSISDLYHRVDAQLLATWPQIDCFPKRNLTASYFDIGPAAGGASPTWPTVGARRILAYLKPFPEIGTMLDAIQRLAASTIIVCPGIDRRLVAQLNKAHMAFVENPLDLAGTISQCDLAISHGSHGFTSQVMLSGKPQLIVPMNLEQRLTGERIQTLGAGSLAYAREPGAIDRALNELWTDSRLSVGAKVLQLNCSQTRIRGVSEAIEVLLPRS